MKSCGCVVQRLVVLAVLACAGIIGAVQVAPWARADATELEPVRQVSEGALQVLGKGGQPAGQCPLKHTAVSAAVSGFVARVDVTQEFVNPLDQKIEAVYTFPLPQDASVDWMEMTVGGRRIVGKIKERDEAKRIYEAAKTQGHVASLLDQERPNIFTQSVANIMPGATVKVRISYVNLLKYEDGQFEFSFPMVVGPRYMPGSPVSKTGTGWAADTDRVPDASRISPPVTPEGTRAGHDISLKMTINSGVPIGRIQSVLHQVDVRRLGRCGASVSLKGGSAIPNKDFILRWQVAGDSVQTGLLTGTRSAGDGYFSLVFIPPAVPQPEQITPKEMIFVIDSSGSQMGWPIEKAKETMRLCVQQMNPGDTFQMLAFSNNVTPLFARPQPNTVENRAFAEEFLNSRLGMGGTEMMKAVQAVLDAPADPRRMRIVCFMTDGYVGNDMEILDYVGKHIGQTRIFPFGIGNGVNRFLLDEMARLGRGAVEYVTLSEKGSAAAGRFAERIAKPLLTDITVDWGGLPVSEVYPATLPDLFSNQPLTLTGRYGASTAHGSRAATGDIVIRGRLGGRPWSFTLPAQLPVSAPEGACLASVWARAKLTDLTTSDYQGIQQGTPNPGVKQEIIQTALDYGLMSQFTSFVAVEEKTVTEGGRPKTVAVPVEMPEGVSYEGIFGDKLQLGQSVPAAKAVAAVSASGSMLGAVQTSSLQPQTAGSPVMARRGAEVADKVDEGKRALRLDKLSPSEKRARLIQSALDPLLQGLKARLDASRNYSVPGKIMVRSGRVKVSVKLTEYSLANLKAVREAGLAVTASSAGLNMVVGEIPVDQLEILALLDGVVRITPAL